MSATRQQRDQDLPPASKVPLRPFFHRNVEASAWGLAVHSRARAIAVSANDHCVTVFYPALTTTAAAAAAPEKASRRINTAVIVGDLDTNIPAISFCNSDDDPDATWLLAATIDGVVFWIDLVGPSVFKAVRACYCAGIRGVTPERCSCGGTLSHASE